MREMREWRAHARSSPVRPKDARLASVFDELVVAQHRAPYLPSNPVIEQRAWVLTQALAESGVLSDPRVAALEAEVRQYRTDLAEIASLVGVGEPTTPALCCALRRCCCRA